ncbi:ATP-dependent RNA helicase HrpA [Terasakiispira papahanaumokuakeensis]|uniref:ATP-dependent RNA helicase HrpA n=1 Tax=Terasakiispira papahanaumokuakeensis TaxID=197479 RepID=A0A1E2V7Y7_9GAMM|nr:ATP-dependent RNA helicase HrpA [Terasakiispira papahanaumokuakeensis]ODC03084.1 ATP-dependent RNA helicase HrpA [Terasakiispira papahanaumokuakeensis]
MPTSATSSTVPEISKLMCRDRHRWQQWQRQLKQSRDPNAQETLKQKLQDLSHRSQAQVQARASVWPSFEYPDLPVSDQRGDILQALRDHQVVVIAGETGSGKTTQLPKLCLELGLGRHGMIGHTQPRRLAARSVANRLCDELGVSLGQQVGYQVRFTEQVADTTLIKLMTDGILLAETRQDRFLNRYEAIIIDEAHERSLNIDFLLGYLKRLLPKRPDLKVIITSATIDVERFSRHFDDCPVIEVSGRTFPVETLYRPLAGGFNKTDDEQADDGEERDDLTLQEGIVEALGEIVTLEREKGWQHGPRDVLVFLPGEREIRETAHLLRRHQTQGQLRDTEVLPLYARLSNAEQNRVFQPHKGRRVVLATNVAETSLTVPGIRYVIDPGVARISRYSYRAKVQRLPVEPVSQASANQRAGRCGRIAPGVCIRLYDEDDFTSRPAFTDPEIRRTNLAAVILQMLSLKLGEIEAFPFVDPPDSRFVRDGFRLLHELGAVDQRNRLTDVGRQLSRLPIDPRLGRMLLQAGQEGALDEVLIIASALNIQDPRLRPPEKQQQADQAHARWKDKESDFAALVNLWRDYETMRQDTSENQLRKQCPKLFLSYLRMREWRDTHRQLKLLCRDLKLTPNAAPADYDSVHKALLAGLLSNVGMHYEQRDYMGTRNRKFLIHPGSALSRKGPKWVMAAELVETSQLFARHVARIDPTWVEPLAEHLVKRQYSEPHWSQKRAQVIAHEKVMLFGLPVVPSRRVHYGPIDPVVSREIFIREGLVMGEYRSRAPFMRHNRAMLDDVRGLEDKARRRDIVVDEDALYDFYDARIPETVINGASFEKWRKQVERQAPQCLFLTREALMAREAHEVTEFDFPDNLAMEGALYKLRYQFAPGAQDDGVSVDVPAAMLGQLPEARLDWMVPGLLRDKCIALLKALPKATRKHFVPIPDHVDQALNHLQPDDETSLTQALAEFLRRKTGVRIAPEDWRLEALPEHLQTNIRVLDEKGRLLGQGRDLAHLREQFAQAAAQAARSLDRDGLEQAGLTEWDFEALPTVIEKRQAGMRIQAYPALVDEGSSVAIRLFDRAEKAAVEHRHGLIRLARLTLKTQDRHLRERLPGLKSLEVMFTKIGPAGTLTQDLLDTSAAQVMLPEHNDELPRDQAAFNAMLERGRSEWQPAAEFLAEQVDTILRTRVALVARLKGKIDLALALTYQDVQRQLERLIYPGFIWHAGAWLNEYPRYLQAVDIRLEKAPRDRLRDQRFAELLEQWYQRWLGRYEQLARQGRQDAEFERFRWLIEEYRVSLYAQQLGTLETVSEKRLEQSWKTLIGAQ